MGDDELTSELERRLCCCSLSSRVSCVMMSDEGLRAIDGTEKVQMRKGKRTRRRKRRCLRVSESGEDGARGT